MFYAIAAEVIPIFLLALVFQMEVRRRRSDEPLAVSFWVLAVVGAMVVGELTALGALIEGQEPPGLAKSVTVIAMVFGILLVGAIPVLPRLEALEARLASFWWETAKTLGVLALGTFALLTSMDVLPVEWLTVAAAGAVMALIVIAAFLTPPLRHRERLAKVRGPSANKGSSGGTDQTADHSAATGHEKSDLA